MSRLSLGSLRGQLITAASLPYLDAWYEPSQLGSLVGVLMDVMLPLIPRLGLVRYRRSKNERESYPDFVGSDGLRYELKLVPVGANSAARRGRTDREPAARIGRNIKRKIVLPNDRLLAIAYSWHIQPKLTVVFAGKRLPAMCPRIDDVLILPMLPLVEARDHDLIERGGRWGAEYPEVPTRKNPARFKTDTNFGKLTRLPILDVSKWLERVGAWPASFT
jgi:hypothetical protein